jgi:toxin ParE1/3/4
MLPIVWRLKARPDLVEIVRHIATEDPAAARRLKTQLEDSVIPLAEHPYLFRAGRVAGTREVVAHPNYVIIYRVTSSEVEIVSVVHARRDYP